MLRFVIKLNVLRINKIQVIAFNMHFCLTKITTEFLSLTDFLRTLLVVVRSIMKEL